MVQSRQLAAIMFTDIVCYTALMGNDEKNAFTLLNKNRQLQKPIIAEFDGRWLKEIGDGTMASFNTVSDSVLNKGQYETRKPATHAQDMRQVGEYYLILSK